MLKVLLSSASLVLLSIFLARCANDGSQASADRLALGKQVYDQHCASCHGAKGEGQYPSAPYKPDKAGLIGAPPHDSTGHTWHHPDGVLLEIIRDGLIVEGFQPMPAFGDKLTAEEMQAVLAYIKMWWKPDQLERQATFSARYTPPAPK
jgi:mono/diheme cytochrome c family protein